MTSSLHDPLPVGRRSLFHFDEEKKEREREKRGVKREVQLEKEMKT